MLTPWDCFTVCFQTCLPSRAPGLIILLHFSESGWKPTALEFFNGVLIFKMQIPRPDLKSVVVGFCDLDFHIPTRWYFCSLKFGNHWFSGIGTCCTGTIENPATRREKIVPVNSLLNTASCFPISAECSNTFQCLVHCPLDVLLWMALCIWPLLIVLMLFSFRPHTPYMLIIIFYSYHRLLIFVYGPSPAGYFWAHFDSSAHGTISTCVSWDQFTSLLFMGTCEKRHALDAQMWA